MDRQSLFLWVWWASVFFFGDQVAQQRPKNHQQDPQDVSQHPLWRKRGVGCSAESLRTKTFGCLQAAMAVTDQKHSIVSPQKCGKAASCQIQGLVGPFVTPVPRPPVPFPLISTSHDKEIGCRCCQSSYSQWCFKLCVSYVHFVCHKTLQPTTGLHVSTASSSLQAIIFISLCVCMSKHD